MLPWHHAVTASGWQPGMTSVESDSTRLPGFKQLGPDIVDHDLLPHCLELDAGVEVLGDPQCQALLGAFGGGALCDEPVRNGRIRSLAGSGLRAPGRVSWHGR